MALGRRSETLNGLAWKGASPAGWEECGVAREPPSAVCSLLGPVVRIQQGHLFSFSLGQQLLQQSRRHSRGEGVTRTCQSLCCPLFCCPSHPPEDVFPFIFISCFTSVTHGLLAIRFALILDLMLIVHTHCPLEGGLAPGLQLMLT